MEEIITFLLGFFVIMPVVVLPYYLFCLLLQWVMGQTGGNVTREERQREEQFRKLLNGSDER